MRIGAALILTLAAALGGYLLGISQAGLVYVPATPAVPEHTEAIPASAILPALTPERWETLANVPCVIPPQSIASGAEPAPSTPPPAFQKPRAKPVRDGRFSHRGGVKHVPTGSEEVPAEPDAEALPDPIPEGE